MDIRIVRDVIKDDVLVTEDECEDEQIVVNSTDVIDALKRNVEFEYKNNPLMHLPSKVSASELSHKLSDKAFDRMLSTPAFMNDQKLTAAQRGTALHAFMQFCDFKKARTDIEAEIQRLTDNGYLSSLQAQSIDIDKAKAFVNSELITRCLSSDKVFKEYRFTLQVPVSLVDSSLDSVETDETIILQGAVDLAFVEDNELVIVDYKTDNVKDVAVLYDMYHNQLEIYKDAMNKCTDYNVKECFIYSVKLEQSIKV